jgi:hypothetical protein
MPPDVSDLLDMPENELEKHFRHSASAGELTPGAGVVGVKRRGHTSHMNVSRLAGFNDRSDPGPGFSFKHLYELTRFFDKHHRF